MQETVRLKDFQLAGLKEFRSYNPPYGEQDTVQIVKDSRLVEFKKARLLMNNAGLETRSITAAEDDLGFLGNNLTHGIMGQMERTVVTGVCFPERPTLQSVLPLLAVKDLLESDRIDMAFVALPVFAYAGAGLSRHLQYLEVLGLMRKLYGQDLGERVVIIPDTRDEVISMKYKISNLSSRFVSDEPAKQKYRFSNLFTFFETASYGADVAIGALATPNNATVVCDFRQFESVHAGNKMAKDMGRKVGALFYTLLSPNSSDGQLREVSQDSDEIFEEDVCMVPETSSLMHQATVLFPKDQAVETYANYRNRGRVEGLREQIIEAQERLFTTPKITDSYVKALEDFSIQKIAHVNDILNEEMQKRLRIPERYRRSSL